MISLNPYQSEHCKHCLQKSRFIHLLNTDEIDLYNRFSKDVNYQAGEIIFKAGRPSNHIVFIRSGFVKEVIDLPNHEQQICRLISKGNFVGLNALLQNGENDTSFIAVSKVVGCAIDLKTVLSLIETNVKFSNHFLRTHCIELKYNFHHFINLTHKSVLCRVAEMLVYFSKAIYQKEEFNNCLNRDEMSNFIQTGKESFSRAITKLKEDGLIQVTGKKVKILDFERLILLSQETKGD